MGATPFFTTPGTSERREEFYRRLKPKNAAPLWGSLADLVLAQPRPFCVPALWKYEEIRPLLMESGELISAQEADRRVLMIQNPGLKGVPQITQSLYAGLQLVLPGEITETHRHKASALRFVIEGDGAYTSVNGTKITMHPGDFILTPSWTWHDHGNATNDPVVWMDGLDIPIVNMMDTSFAEHYPDGTQQVLREETETPFSFPYSRSRKALEQFLASGQIDSWHGVRLHYGDDAGTMPTIDAWLQLLPAGFGTKPCRSTDATVFCVTEGHGQTRIGNTTLVWGRHDIFMAPSWEFVSHEAEAESVLFSFSDRPLQKILGLWREETSEG
ncbi:MAG TPA: cupin domain-containing protein [Bryobacteraceae bacterium]|jgi:gentisate 1,2-dioxygenase|nr:cupin domain-containing protein [Bryobacteraceae bacterium]